ncbi:MAG: AAA family ATPase [Spirochaetes bacterium]|nr:AAA family ATPase [Spirochaetota bacterium]
MLKREPFSLIFSEEYKNKMRFIAGPRQSGKTTLAQNFLKKRNLLKLYYNWDTREVRNKYYQNSYFYNDDLLSFPANIPKWICFDEIHKMPKWKNILKDIYDTDKENVNFIITGSARLDMFRKSGDSLTGRYYLFHLFPLSLTELINKDEKDFFIKKDIDALKFIERRLAVPEYFQAEMLGNIPLVQLIYKNNIAKKIGKNSFVISASRFLG